MLRHRLKKFSQSLKPVVAGEWSKGLFIILVFLGLIISLLFHKPPWLLISVFAVWTFLFAVTFLLDASIEALKRNIIPAVWLLLLFGLFISLSYASFRVLIEEAF
jgi:hypothetical protein